MEIRGREQGRSAQSAAVALLSALLLGGVAHAQSPTPADLESAERALAAAKASRAASLRAFAAEEDRLRAAVSAAKSRREEAVARTSALGRVAADLQSARSAAESRSTAASTLRAGLEAALERAASTLRARREPADADLSGDAAVRETGAPLARRLSALFHLLDRSRPEEARIAVGRHVVSGVAGRILRVGSVASYFVPDDPRSAPVFHPSGRPLPAESAATVRRAADIAEKKSDPAVLRLPLEPRS